MFSRSVLAARPLAARASCVLATSALRTAVPAVRPAMAASLHVSARTQLQATTKVAQEGEEPPADPREEPKNTHDHPRIWEDVNLETLSHLLTPAEAAKEGPSVDTKVTLIDFYADWCGPCKTLSPVLQALAKDEKLDTTLISLDVDKHPEVAQGFQIKALPTVYGLYEGKPVRQFQGVLPEDILRQFVQDLPMLSAQDAQGQPAEASEAAN